MFCDYSLDARLRGNDRYLHPNVMPAKAGIQKVPGYHGFPPLISLGQAFRRNGEKKVHAEESLNLG